MKKLYEEYVSTESEQAGSSLSDEAKVSLAKRALQVELGSDFVNSEAGKSDSAFPAFYALDLI